MRFKRYSPGDGDSLAIYTHPDWEIRNCLRGIVGLGHYRMARGSASGEREEFEKWLKSEITYTEARRKPKKLAANAREKREY